MVKKISFNNEKYKREFRMRVGTKIVDAYRPRDNLFVRKETTNASNWELGWIDGWMNGWMERE